MNYQQKDWLGSWQNFESYLVSTAPAMQACWTQAEEAAKALPMFQAGKTPRVSPCEPLCARLKAGVVCVPDEGRFSPHRASTAAA